MDDLSDRQQLILNYILSELQKKGYPPSVREIGEAVGLSSSSSVHAHLARLEEMGYLRRDPTKPRAIEVLIGNNAALDVFQPNNIKYIPIIGSVTAGQPIFAEQNVQDYFPLPSDFSSAEEVYMLKVKGDSMINAGIYDGDFVIVNRSSAAANGEIVVALVDDEATVKRFYKEKSQVRLQPENDLYEPIISTNVNIAGKVIGLIRKIN